jgi:hypothetical protein
MRKGRFLGAVLAGLMAGCAVTATLAQEVHYSPEAPTAAPALALTPQQPPPAT